MKIGNFKGKVVGVKMRNTDSRKNGGSATQKFKKDLFWNQRHLILEFKNMT